MYRVVFWFFKKLDAEKAHRLGFALIRAAAAVPGLRHLLRRWFAPRDPILETRVFGQTFSGPLGLAAGFDKNAESPRGLSMLGFAFVEVGTVTAQPQPGNPKPRMFRLPSDRALVNRMGFNNQGAKEAATQLASYGRLPTVIGVNIGKSKVVPEDEAIADYVASTQLVAKHADYLVVNVSSPNTPGLRNLQAVDHLRPLLTAVRETMDKSVDRRIPLLVKIAPDLADEDIDEVAALAMELELDGVIATNTTISRDGLTTPANDVAELGAGGLSGAPLKARSLEVLQRLHRQVNGKIVLIAAGGIETADDAWERILAGASLIQGYTGFIYGGPAWPRKIHKGLAERVRKAGFTSISDAVGAATPR